MRLSIAMQVAGAVIDNTVDGEDGRPPVQHQQQQQQQEDPQAAEKRRQQQMMQCSL
jgi:hypothetical protein